LSASAELLVLFLGNTGSLVYDPAESDVARGELVRFCKGLEKLPILKNTPLLRFCASRWAAKESYRRSEKSRNMI